jgi:hypothetical protein
LNADSFKIKQHPIIILYKAKIVVSWSHNCVKQRKVMSDLVYLEPKDLEAFNQNGYILLREVLSKSAVKSLLNEVNSLVDSANEEGTIFHEEYYHEKSYKLGRILRLTESFDHLIDHPGYFGKIVSLIGSHLQMMGTEIFVRGSAQDTITKFHTDLGAGMQALLPVNGAPYLQIKAQIFLTDLSQPYSSNFTVIPGSHVKPVPENNPLCHIDHLNKQIGPDGQLPKEALQILAKPGDVLLFPHTLWHSVAPNYSKNIRKSICFRYGQLALRSLERFDPILSDSTRKLTVRQRRVLGDLGGGTPSAYRPEGQDEIIRGL